MDEELVPAPVGIHRDASRRTTEPGHLLGDQPIEVTEGVETQYGHRIPPSACLALIGAKASPLRACAPRRFFKLTAARIAATLTEISPIQEACRRGASIPTSGE
jgi:hypothetical protein